MDSLRFNSTPESSIGDLFDEISELRSIGTTKLMAALERVSEDALSITMTLVEIAPEETVVGGAVDEFEGYARSLKNAVEETQDAARAF
jgi:hypothetical protein